LNNCDSFFFVFKFVEAYLKGDIIVRANTEGLDLKAPNDFCFVHAKFFDAVFFLCNLFLMKLC